MILVAVSPGAGGNSISLTVTPNMLPGAHNLALTISVVGVAITVQAATDNTGAVTSTELDVVNLINATPAASALVVASTVAPAALAPATGGTQFLFGGSGSSLGGYAGLDGGTLKILLTDTNQINISNLPLLFSNLIHVPQTAPNLLSTSHSVSIPENFWPTPPMLYRVNSSIRFYIYVTTVAPLGGDSTWDFTFSGVRRYPCK